ncbi:MAG TPA: FliH/SctL family protein [Novosphingobium sp.]|nr:FliH/SctL family protein [Novosphingobium sp.]
MKMAMDGSAAIRPFGFDRVFHLVEDALAVPELPLGPPSEPSLADLREMVAERDARIERLHAEHREELARARADGFEAGALQARSERAEAMLSATDALHAAFDDIDARFDVAVQAMIGEAGAVALHAAEMLAGHAVDVAPARAVDEALGRALEQVARETALVVRANPAMRADLEDLVAAREAGAGRRLTVTVVDDADVAEGDARIEWSTGGLNVDATARWTAVMAELAGILPERVGA